MIFLFCMSIVVDQHDRLTQIRPEDHLMSYRVTPVAFVATMCD